MMAIKYKLFEAQHDGKFSKIEEDLPEVGYYLYVYENDKCTFDYLQDNINQCKEQAHEQFGVPFDNWRQINSN